MSTTQAGPLKLRVAEALGKDIGRAFARMDPADLDRLGVEVGDIIEVAGSRKTVCKAMPAYKESRGQSRMQIDGLSRENAKTGLDQLVEVRKTEVRPAERVSLAPVTISPRERDLPYIGSLLDGLPVLAGDRIRVTLFGTRSADFTVTDTAPRGPVLINPTTALEVGKPEAKEAATRVSYEEIGGLRRELFRIREIIELPLRYPEVFDHLGVDAPKGVLLHGPPGCGKTLIARAVAHETEASFFSVNGPEVVHKFYGESEAHLRKIFEQARRQAPSIVFIDEIDAIAPRREQVVGEVEKRVVAQLLALMDGLAKREHVIVIGATNIPNALDPALRRPGRFDREIAISIPDRNARREILEIHSRGMPLAPDVDLETAREKVDTFRNVRREYDPIYQWVFGEGRINPEMRFLHKMAVIAELERDLLTIREPKTIPDPKAIAEEHGIHFTMNCPDVDAAFEMEKRILEIRDEGDSSGGVIEAVATGLPVGMGEPVFAKLDGEMGRMLSIGAIKAVEVGAGYAVKDMRGSECNDAMRVVDGKVVFPTNRAGGVTGGLSTGQPLVARLAVKPTPTIAKDQDTIDKVSLENRTLSAVTRRDPTIVARVWPVAEAFLALIVLDNYMMHLGYQAMFCDKKG